MKNRINYKALIPYFNCIIASSFTLIINFHLIEQTPSLRRIWHNNAAGKYYYFSHLAAEIALLIFSSYFTTRIIGIFSGLASIAGLMIIGLIGLSDTGAKIWLAVFSGLPLIILTISMSQLFCHKKIKGETALALFVLGICFAYFLAELVLLHNLVGIRSALPTSEILSAVSLLGFLYFFSLTQAPSSQIPPRATNSLAIIRNAELELLSAFSISYICGILLCGYEVYNLTHSLLMILVSEIKYCVVALVLCVLLFTSKFIFKYNPYRANALYLATLAVLFLLIPFWAHSMYLDLVCWSIIMALLYFAWLTNLVILIEKFEFPNLQTAVILYMLASAAGAAATYLAADPAQAGSGNNFLTPIHIILLGLLAYSLYLYKRNNNKEW